MESTEIQEGVTIVEGIWYFTAVSIVELAIQVYKLDVEQSNALREVFLKQNNYYVQLQD